jgi:DNA polymerase-3 subunit chi
VGTPRIDFYVLPETLPPLRFACTMAAKARSQNLTVHVHAASRDDAVALDDLLWSFSDISFLPHALVDDPDHAARCPIVLGWEGARPARAAVLINLSEAIPDFVAEFERVVEPVQPLPGPRARARDRYRTYRERGWELYHHDLEGREASA